MKATISDLAVAVIISLLALLMAFSPPYLYDMNVTATSLVVYTTTVTQRETLTTTLTKVYTTTMIPGVGGIQSEQVDMIKGNDYVKLRLVRIIRGRALGREIVGFRIQVLNGTCIANATLEAGGSNLKPIPVTLAEKIVTRPFAQGEPISEGDIGWFIFWAPNTENATLVIDTVEFPVTIRP